MTVPSAPLRPSRSPAASRLRTGYRPMKRHKPRTSWTSPPTRHDEAAIGVARARPVRVPLQLFFARSDSSPSASWSFNHGVNGATPPTTLAPCCTMLQQPASCVIMSPLPARELGVAERIAGGRGRHARAPVAVAMSMFTTTAQRVEDVRRQQLLAPQTVEPWSGGPWRAGWCSAATAVLLGTLAHGCRRTRGPRLYGRGVPWGSTL